MMAKRYQILILFLVITCTSCYLGEELPPDQVVWDYAHPSTVDLNEASLLDLNQSITNESYEQINGLIIIKDDKLVFENYYNQNDRREIKSVGRVSFSVFTLAIDFLVRDGYLDLDEYIVNYLPEYESLFEGDSLKQLITVRDLLTYRSGLVWNETLLPGNDLFGMQSTGDWVSYVLSKPMEAPPGLRTVINSGGGMVIAKIAQNQLGEIDLVEYLDQRLFDPVGITTYTWEKTPREVLNVTTGLSLSTLDLTRIGYLMLQEGRWSNKLRVIEADWVFAITDETSQVDTNYSFGYTWWLFSESFSRRWLNKPNNTVFFTAGESGQNLYVLPEENMVICITADNYDIDFINLSLSLFVKSLEALEEPDLTN